MLGAVFAAFVGLAAAQCVSPNTTCAISEYSVCVEKTCSMQMNMEACTQANCTWSNERCEDPTETCSNATTSTDCDALSTNCTWRTMYCKPGTHCSNSDGTACATTPDGECPSDCEEVADCSEVADRCVIPTNQTECTENPGCFWAEAFGVVWGRELNFSQCVACFSLGGDDTNQFYSALSMVNLTCTGYAYYIEYTLAVAASTGCSGGRTVPLDGCMTHSPTTSSPTTNTPTSSPTTSTPTSSPTTSAPTTLAPSVSTEAPTDSTVSGAVARGAVGLMAVTLLGTFLLA